MQSFIWDSDELRDYLAGDSHAAGEIRVLQSLARPGMIAIDAGANKGLTTAALATGVAPDGHVYAFEPVPEYYERLWNNLSRNGIENVTAYRAALSDRAGELPFYVHGEGSGITAEEGAEMLTVQAVSIDQFLRRERIPRVDIISLDCEGSELLVFKGAQKTLREQRPLVFCEIHHDYLKRLGQRVGEIEQLFGEIGYVVEPLSAEHPGEHPGLEACSHIRAHPAQETAGSEERVRELRKKIADLKARWPAHSVPPSLLQELEELEEELQRAEGRAVLDGHG